MVEVGIFRRQKQAATGARTLVNHACPPPPPCFTGCELAHLERTFGRNVQTFSAYRTLDPSPQTNCRPQLLAFLVLVFGDFQPPRR